MAVATSLRVAQNYTTHWTSKNSDIFDPVFRKKLYNIYGDGVRIFDWLTAAGSVENVPNAEIKHIEEFAPMRAIKIKSAIATGAAGADITVVLDAVNFDTDGYNPTRVGFTILIPASNQPLTVNNSREYRIMSRSTATLTNDTLVCRPLSGDGNTQTASQITTAVAAGTWLQIGPSSYAPGTGQPEGRTDSYSTITHKARIYKETLGIEGGQVAQQFREAMMMNGQKGLVNKGIFKLEFDHDKQIDQGICYSEENDNSSLTQTSTFGGTPAIKSGKGLFTWADEKAQKVYYTGSYNYSDFDINKQLFESQGVTSTAANYYVGPELWLQLENAGLDQIREYSGGTELYDKVQKYLGIDIKIHKKAGITYMIQEVKSFANPNTYGINVSDAYTYEYPKAGLIIPNGKKTLRDFGGKKDYSIENLALGYVNNNGEDRTRILKVKPGVSGVIDSMVVADDKDGYFFYLLTEMMTLVHNANQFIYVREQK
jgi:hypothetical protein